MREFVGSAIIAVVYLCIAVIIFAPTIYMGWLYWIGRKLSGKARGMLRLAMLTFIINGMVAYFLMHFAFNYFLTAKMAEWDAMTRTTMHNAVASQKSFFSSHGRYYPVGPVRGPYNDGHGLSVSKDVILEVVPRWEKQSGGESIEVYAVHVLAKDLMISSEDGRVERARDSPENVKMKERLFNSVR